jgi:hypothetical protein
MMSIKESVTVKDTVAFLNELVKVDRGAMVRLFGDGRTHCNEALAKHPTVQVGYTKGKRYASGGTSEVKIYSVGLLGILNGLFGVDAEDWGTIAACYEVVCPDCGSIDKGLEGEVCPVCGEPLVCGDLTHFRDLGRR